MPPGSLPREAFLAQPARRRRISGQTPDLMERLYLLTDLRIPQSELVSVAGESEVCGSLLKLRSNFGYALDDGGMDMAYGEHIYSQLTQYILLCLCLSTGSSQ